MQKTIGFIGAGKIASALISCIHNKKIAKSIIASGRKNNVLSKIIGNEDIGTIFYPEK